MQILRGVRFPSEQFYELRLTVCLVYAHDDPGTGTTLAQSHHEARIFRASSPPSDFHAEISPPALRLREPRLDGLESGPPEQ
jgi:hypothetical protein